MTDERLRALERRFRETGARVDELAWLTALERSGLRLSWERYQRLHALEPEAASDYLRRCVDPADLDLAARFGSPGAAAALSLGPQEFPEVYASFYDRGLRGIFRARYEPALAYFYSVLNGLLDWWAQRDAQYQESVNELRPFAEIVANWLRGERGSDAERHAQAWAQSTTARAELVGGRFDAEDRALSHLVHALGLQAYACAPLWAPFHSGLPEGVPRTKRGVPQDEDTIRFQRVASAHFEVFEAICGLTYTVLGRYAPATDFSETQSATLRRFEELGARALERWLLTRSLPEVSPGSIA